MTADDVLKLYLEHELEKSYSDVNTHQTLILDAMEKYSNLRLREEMIKFIMKHHDCDEGSYYGRQLINEIDRYLKL